MAWLWSTPTPGAASSTTPSWLAATAVAAGIGAAGGAATGSLVGALKNSGHTEEKANVYSEGVRRGGTLVSAKVADSQVVEAEAVLDRNKSVDAASRGAAYRQSGWSTFDADAPAYTSNQVDQERARYGAAATTTDRY